MPSIKRISTNDLEVGMYIANSNNEWIPNGNLSRCGLIKDPLVVAKIKSLGIPEIYIDIARGKAPESLATSNLELIKQKENIQSLLKKPHIRLNEKTSFDAELAVAKKIQSEGLALVESVMTNVKYGQAVDVNSTKELAGNVIESLLNNQNALLCLTQLRTKDKYLVEHSFNVSIFMGILAVSLNIMGDELNDLVTGALLHDVGKIKVSDGILNKPGKLTSEEWREMQMHVTFGEQYLRDVPGLSKEIIDICAQHHERLDGSGYPRKLTASEIPLHSRMAAVVDVYDAITADRVYHQGMAPAIALKKMVEWSDEIHLDKDLVYQFIRCLSVYPQGSFVLLNNQRLGIVQALHKTEMKKPVITIVYNLEKNIRVPNFPMDLSDPSCSCKIERVVLPEEYGLNLNELLGTLG